ncbi:nascent polypeptide-associated complex protein [Candidatus Bathyarchaeota archaeon]|nr:nascent polypeptide-associated complex protein [Candidatus Bathyarchaeota archaeon]
MQRRVNPREAKRMMQRMGMSMDGVEDVTEVVIRTHSKEIVIEQPEVAMLNMQGQRIYQVVGGTVTERKPERTISSKPTFSEEDVRLVADQTGKSVEEAKNALIECEGDLAKAILLLQS